MRPRPSSVLAVALVVACLVAAGVGQLHVPVDQVLGSVLHRLGIDVAADADRPARRRCRLWQVRFPRVVLGGPGGWRPGLRRRAHAGGVRQPARRAGRHRRVVGCRHRRLRGDRVRHRGAGQLDRARRRVPGRPPGDPRWCTPWRARAAGPRWSRSSSWASRSRAFAGAIIGMLTFVSSDDALRSIAFWNLGSLARATWEAVFAVAPFVIVGVGVAHVLRAPAGPAGPGGARGASPGRRRGATAPDHHRGHRGTGGCRVSRSRASSGSWASSCPTSSAS